MMIKMILIVSANDGQVEQVKQVMISLSSFKTTRNWLRFACLSSFSIEARDGSNVKRAKMKSIDSEKKEKEKKEKERIQSDFRTIKTSCL